MAINYKKTAEEIIRVVNKDNIISATFCATRLRLIVKNRESIKDLDVQKIEGVKGVFFNSDQYQIILGTGVVNKVYAEVVNLGVTGAAKQNTEETKKVGYRSSKTKYGRN